MRAGGSVVDRECATLQQGLGIVQSPKDVALIAVNNCWHGYLVTLHEGQTCRFSLGEITHQTLQAFWVKLCQERGKAAARTAK